ncbi:hypothetical protein [Verrucomicrobium sp. BvORR034]|uniref:hypothetical protein n=1 Tax=Verrucomicrobium sp. BvORR034 TaxID=1396418 RepID=UPI002240F60D|nr:hypothetical protein [Verrucomicrobium sp. BvORR034]
MKLAERMLTDSPFLRRVSPQETIFLTGVAIIHGAPFVTVYDSSTRSNHTLSLSQDARGWSVVSVKANSNPLRATAIISINGENVNVRYAANQARDLSDSPKSRDAGAESEIRRRLDALPEAQRIQVFKELRARRTQQGSTSDLERRRQTLEVLSKVEQAMTK